MATISPKPESTGGLGIPVCDARVEPSGKQFSVRFRDAVSVDLAALKTALDERAGADQLNIEWHSSILVARRIVCEMNSDSAPVSKFLWYRDLEARPTALAGYRGTFRHAFSQLEATERHLATVRKRLHESARLASKEAQVAAFATLLTLQAMTLIMRLREFRGLLVYDRRWIILSMFTDLPVVGTSLMLMPIINRLAGAALDGPRHFLGARVGVSEQDFQWVALPQRTAEKLQDAGQGSLSEEDYHRWVLPQWIALSDKSPPPYSRLRVTVLKDHDEEEKWAVTSQAPWSSKPEREAPSEQIVAKGARDITIEDTLHVTAVPCDNEAPSTLSTSPPDLSPAAGEQQPKIDFVILTAIEVERKAVCAALNLDNSPRHREDGRAYWRGSLSIPNGGCYELVVEQALDGANVDMAVLTTDAIHHWRPASALLVGIAGSAVEQVRVGDVVAASEIYYYERGKSTPGGKLPEPKIASPDAVLWGRVSSMSDWDGRVPVPRPNDLDGTSKLHKGVIACGEKVIADKAFRDEVAAQHRKILAVEMEGYGFIRAIWQSPGQVRCLVIRGISDPASAAKDDKWHHYAAGAAATFARRFLEERPIEPRNTGERPNPR